MKIPFIVEYEECFHFDNTLIIVMEYCERILLAKFRWRLADFFEELEEKGRVAG